MNVSEFIKTTITGPRASCQVDLPGLGDAFNETQTALYVMVDAERCDSIGARSAGHGYAAPDAPYRTVHVISRWAHGEIRGYVWTDGKLFVRQPDYAGPWPELDALVEEAIGAKVANGRGLA